MNTMYMLLCADGSLYTGWTNDLEKRLNAHAAGTASRYTRSRLPVRLLLHIECEASSQARRLEVLMKRLTRAQKKALLIDEERLHTWLDSTTDLPCVVHLDHGLLRDLQ